MNASNVVFFAMSLSTLLVLAYEIGLIDAKADIAELCDKQGSFIHVNRMFSCSLVSLQKGGGE